MDGTTGNVTGIHSKQLNKRNLVPTWITQLFHGSPLIHYQSSCEEAHYTMDGTTDGTTTVYPQQWKKRYLVPCWIIQLISFAIFASFEIWVLKLLSSDPDADDDGDLAAAKVFIIVLLAMSCIGSALTFVEIFMYAFKKLRPVWVVISSVIKQLISLILLIIESQSVKDVEDAGDERGTSLTQLLWLISAMLVVAVLLELIYGAIKTHRWRRARRNAEKDVVPAPSSASNNSAPLHTGAPPMAMTAHNSV